MSHPSLSHFLIYIAHLCPLAFYKEMLFIPSTGSLLSLWKLWCRGKDPVSCSEIICAFLGRQSGKKQSRELCHKTESECLVAWKIFLLFLGDFFPHLFLGMFHLVCPLVQGENRNPLYERLRFDVTAIHRKVGLSFYCSQQTFSFMRSIIERQVWS